MRRPLVIVAGSGGGRRGPRAIAARLGGKRAGRPATNRSWEKIYTVVRRIPRGRVATYGQVAALAGFPRAPRVAGYALYALPDGTPVPWHRVVGAGGRLSLARLSLDGALMQRMRLEREGVGFDARGRVRIGEFGWKKGKAQAPYEP